MSTVSLLRKIDESEPAQEHREDAGFDLPPIERAVREILFAVAFRGEFERNQALRAEAVGLLRPQGGPR